jgi:hypothetical protein
LFVVQHFFRLDTILQFLFTFYGVYDDMVINFVFITHTLLRQLAGASRNDFFLAESLNLALLN